jgi:hypothetical protein
MDWLKKVIAARAEGSLEKTLIWAGFGFLFG